MAITLEEVMARERIKMEHDEVILSKLKAKEYKLHPDTTYLLTFESVLKPQEMSALRNIFSGSARNIYMLSTAVKCRTYIHWLKVVRSNFPKRERS